MFLCVRVYHMIECVMGIVYVYIGIRQREITSIRQHSLIAFSHGFVCVFYFLFPFGMFIMFTIAFTH